MPFYLIIAVDVADAETYSEYVRKVSGIVAKHGGKYLARGGEVIPISGGWNPERVVLIEFPTEELVRRCFRSPEYLEIAPLRERATRTKAIVVEGCDSRESPPQCLRGGA
ncbi:MAG TPA: DUF1330 domain-containing protein [bacterium]|nr:DUF1330 domain-containing protein [bacterium]HPJ71392.1 DUF1330 domain-containing protein [bacterium]HPQ67198.1 DUF1330 domain-containing protein [bacterium]